MFKRLTTVAVALCMACLVQTPIVSNLPAFADSPPVLNENTDPKILRKYVWAMDELIKKKGPKVRYYVSKGQYLEWLNKNRAAVESYTKAIQIDSKNAAAYLGRARNFRYLKEYEKSARDYSSAIENGEKTAETYAGRALVSAGMKNYRKAVLDAQAAIKIDPTYHGAWFAKGFSELKLGNASESILSFSEAIKLNPRDADLYALRSDAYARSGDRSKAKKDRELYLKYSSK